MQLLGGTRRLLSPPAIARAQGVFNVVGGAWPLLGMRSFEAVYGPKVDRWLECTVAGLLLTVGVAQTRARTEDQVKVARLLGVGTAVTLLAVDLVNVPRGRLRATYLQDAACELGWLVAWGLAGRSAGTGQEGRT